DVLSRQQSAFNRQTVTALQELAECCAVLDHALATSNASKAPQETEQPRHALPDRELSSLTASIEHTLAAGKADEIARLLHHLVHQLVETQRRFAALEARLSSGQGAAPASGQMAREGSFPGETAA